MRGRAKEWRSIAHDQITVRCLRSIQDAAAIDGVEVRLVTELPVSYEPGSVEHRIATGVLSKDHTGELRAASNPWDMQALKRRFRQIGFLDIGVLVTSPLGDRHERWLIAVEIKSAHESISDGIRQLDYYMRSRDVRSGVLVVEDDRLVAANALCKFSHALIHASRPDGVGDLVRKIINYKLSKVAATA